MDKPAFSAWHRWDRSYHLLFVVAAWVAVLMGFYPSVALRYAGRADYPAPVILQMHVFTFAAWLCLLTIQMVLVRGRHLGLHRKLGMAGAAMIPVLVFTGIGAEIHSQTFYAATDPENPRFFIIPIAEMVLFVGFATLAIMRRGDLLAHKRLILLATTILLPAAYNRWWGPAIDTLLDQGYWWLIIRFFGGPNLLMVIAVLYDRITRGRVHPVLAQGVPLAFATELATAVIYYSDWWPGLVRQLLKI